MDSDPISPLSKAMYTPPQSLPRSSRKRSRHESSGESAASFDGKIQRLYPSEGTSCQDHAGTSLEEQTGHQDPLPLEIQPFDSNGGVEDRRKFKKQEGVQTTGASTGTWNVGQLSSTEEDLSHDPMTLELGLSWKSISKKSDNQAAARGWVKYIEKRYALNDVSILAQHSNGYLLAGAHGGIYIFDQDISCGAFIADSWVDCVKQLQSRHAFVWQGCDLLHPVGSRVSSQPRGLNNANGQNMDTTLEADTSQEASCPPLPNSAIMGSDWGPWNSDPFYPTGNLPNPQRNEEPGTPEQKSEKEADSDRMAVD